MCGRGRVADVDACEMNAEAGGVECHTVQEHLEKLVTRRYLCRGASVRACGGPETDGRPQSMSACARQLRPVTATRCVRKSGQRVASTCRTSWALWGGGLAWVRLDSRSGVAQRRSRIRKWPAQSPERAGGREAPARDGVANPRHREVRIPLVFVETRAGSATFGQIESLGRPRPAQNPNDTQPQTFRTPHLQKVPGSCISRSRTQAGGSLGGGAIF